MMALPGKLSIGFMQEDNPVKSYFRIRPVATLEDDGYTIITDLMVQYPEDGYIRIVPDKNELAQFKTRMRALGRYCALDLRKYPGENEKIRPNKNYGIGVERNASIVYSDAIGVVPDTVLVEVLDAQYVFVGEQVTLRAERPCTRHVLVRREGKILGPWVWTDAPDMQGCLLLNHAPGYAFTAIAEAELEAKLLKLANDGVSVVLMTDPSVFGIGVQQPVPAFAPGPSAELKLLAEPGLPAESGRPAESKSVVESEPPVEPEHLVAPEHPAEPERPVEPERPAEPEPLAESEPPVKLEQPAEAGSSTEPESQTQPTRSGPPPKPWLQKVEVPHPRAIAGRLNLRDQALMAQSGINPRKGRSLSEVIDEHWRRSRYDQLGHPVPGGATSRPAISPIDRAAVAVRDAWQLTESRAGLIERLLEDEAFAAALAERLNLNVAQAKSVSDERAAELESERLKLMTEIDALRQRRAEVKKQLMEELKQTHSREIKKHEEKVAALNAAIKRNEDAAYSARQAAEAARGLLKQTSEQLEQQILSHLMTGRAVELIMHMNGQNATPVQQPNTYEPTAGELISDLRVQLESAGFQLNNEDAIGLLASMLTCGMAIVSGPTGCGKSGLVRGLAAALGLTGPARRFAEARSPDAPEARALIEHCDGLTPCILLLDDINLSTDDSAVNGVIRLQEEAYAKGLPLWLMLTVQDAPEGRALPMRLFARAFFIRLDPASADARWKPPELKPPCPDRAVALGALRDIFRPVAELESEVESRLITLRRELEAINYFLDRRTLNQLWAYCASIARVKHVPGMTVLDRALATRALPAMLASMELPQLVKLPELLCDMPLCMKLMEQPLPLPPL